MLRNHIKTRKKAKRRMLIDRALCIVFQLIAWGVFALMMVLIAFMDFPEKFGVPVMAMCGVLFYIGIRFWGVLDEEERVHYEDIGA